MAKVQLFRFKIYDGALDRLIPSRRWGTREAIDMVRGIALEESEIEVEAPSWDCLEGLTEVGFDPHRQTSAFATHPLRNLSSPD